MTIHKTGYGFIFLIFLALLLLNMGVWCLTTNYPVIYWIFTGLSLSFFSVVVYFFRKPNRPRNINPSFVYAPADGTVVVIEEVFEDEFFHDKRKQISVFMSPLNVHINWTPIAGIIKYFKYHIGKHYCAWLPKSSTDNEHSTVVVEMNDGTQILIRQIAGALARRIVTSINEGDKVEQNSEIGFIKFGSRVDIFLPLNAKVNAVLDQKVIGTQTVLAELVN
ncbi:MAG: phosphatidylserine decarboxylase [Bacteroidetes bacterium RIFOXYA12_FULL_35_11]|nr:MAG: phosphatidylserine decarboxylase [Bacteroidetes bacterium GWF2_35_48]OFY72676.1 MAG: phosphatidylserine decarboxylase [Bacteroidetes bacterium RIFOXYA12_FULL_35_11]OFY92607.1 MAG: phosphatidylserine decarboxylase [Bacteroidetes bacterium RIFOXYC12_FULL_35_7]OFY97398.1 MAG: phosphatidylserine decarboxylase [Bacteroidetes bacterium RIFOXYB2_FULL_35_7]HBX50987.1 phosphatidylserine decarboxylase family protein [Bacteroidales bacterium]